jgi:hypothetical protein
MTDLDHGADLRERIDRAMSDLSAPEGLTPAVLTEGHRLRRRRRVLTSATGLAAAAVVAGLVVANVGGGTPSTETGFATEPSAQPSVDQPSPSAGLPSLAPETDLESYEPPPGWWDMPSEQMAAHLEQLLPEGVTASEVVTESDDPAPGQDPINSGWLHATLEGDAGPGGFEIILYPPELDNVPDPVTTTDAEGNENTQMYAEGTSYQQRTNCPGNLIRPDSCVEITGGGGVHIGRESVTTTRGVTVHEVVVNGPDGGLVYFATSNSTDDKWGALSTVSANEPPLALDQLRELALDPVWTSYQP